MRADRGLQEVLLAELRYHRERLAEGAEAVTVIGQHIFVLVGVGAVASTQSARAIVIIPLFWTTWLLHGLQRAWDGMKHEIFAVDLERRLAALHPDEGLTLWNSAAAHKEYATPLVATANFAYWVLLNLTAWCVAVVVLLRASHPYDAVALTVVGVGTYVVCWRIVAEREQAVAELRQKLEAPS